MRICIFARTMFRHRLYFQSSMVLLTKQFSEMGHHVTVLTRSLPDGSGAIFHDGGGEVHYLAGLKKGKNEAAFWSDTAKKFDELHQRDAFDLIVGRGDSPYGYFTQSRYSGKVPVIEHEGTYPLWLHQIETRKSRILTALTPVFGALFAFEKRAKRACFRMADRVVCNSPALAMALKKVDWPRPPKTAFIPYGFDVSKFAPKIGQPESPPRLVFVGRLTWDKGILKMIEILAGLERQDVIFEAIGPVSDRIRAALVKYARSKGVADRFLMPGTVMHTDLPNRLAGALAFVFPSTHPEGLSKAVLEAMAASLPIVAFDIPGQDTLVEHGVTGWLESPRDVGALTARVNFLLAEPGLGSTMGAAGRAKVMRDFAPAVITSLWQGLFTSVLREHADRHLAKS